MQNNLNFCKPNSPVRNKCTANEILILIRSIKVKTCTDSSPSLKDVLKSDINAFLPVLPLTLTSVR